MHEDYCKCVITFLTKSDLVRLRAVELNVRLCVGCTSKAGERRTLGVSCSHHIKIKILDEVRRELGLLGEKRM